MGSDEKLLISMAVFSAIAIGLGIYGYTLLNPKKNGEVKPKKTEGYLLMSLPWIIPLGLFVVYLNRDKNKNMFLSGSDPADSGPYYPRRL